MPSARFPFLFELSEKKRKKKGPGTGQECQFLSTYQDSQPAVNVQVFEGKEPMTMDNHLLGNIMFEEPLQYLVASFRLRSPRDRLQWKLEGGRKVGPAEWSVGSPGHA